MVNSTLLLKEPYVLGWKRETGTKKDEILIVKNTFYEYVHSEHRPHARTKSQPVFGHKNVETSNPIIDIHNSLKSFNAKNHNDIVAGDTVLAPPEVKTVEMIKVKKNNRFYERKCRAPNGSYRTEKTISIGHENTLIQCDDWTTVMLRNIPNNYTRWMLKLLLDRLGFRAYYNFIYVPIDFWRCAGRGYAFINFVNKAHALHFWNNFNNFSDWGIPSKKRCILAWSYSAQGLRANIELHRNNSVMHRAVPDVYKPMLLEKGEVVALPDPSISLKAPRYIKNKPKQCNVRGSNVSIYPLPR